MLKIIVYNDEKKYIDKTINAVNKALLGYCEKYNIYTFNQYSEDLIKIITEKYDLKIYILNIDCTNFSGLDVALKIRENDLNSVIILTGNFIQSLDIIFKKRLLILDFIDTLYEYENRIKKDILFSIKYLYRNKNFEFKYKHIFYRIPYVNINYIEKEPLIKRCIIHTTEGNYYIVNSIERLSKILGSQFMRTHQSCLINLSNVFKVDFSNNIITFKNGEVSSLITDKMKKIIKDNI